MSIWSIVSLQNHGVWPQSALGSLAPSDVLVSCPLQVVPRQNQHITTRRPTGRPRNSTLAASRRWATEVGWRAHRAVRSRRRSQPNAMLRDSSGPLFLTNEREWKAGTHTVQRLFNGWAKDPLVRRKALRWSHHCAGFPSRSQATDAAFEHAPSPTTDKQLRKLMRNQHMRSRWARS